MDTPGPSSGKRKRTSFSPGELQTMIEAGLSSEDDISLDEFSEDEYLPDYSDVSLGEEESESEEEEEDSVSVLSPIDWSEGPVTFNVFPFQQKAGISIDQTQIQTAYAYFRLLFSDEVLDLILTETNRYAQQKVQSGKYKTFVNWKNLERSELLVFFALLFHMGIVSLPTLKDYWRTDILYKMSFFSNYMKRDRFLKILSCLHFVDNCTADKTNKLWKCQPILDYFNNKMLEIYVPEKELSIDESMMLFRGRLSFRQYIKNKRHKYGLKFYMLCESTGLVQKILLYTGRGTMTGDAGHSATVVYELADNYLNKGYCLYMDNFYNSFTLSKSLLDKKTHTTGTLGKKRKGNSQDVLKRKLKKGESVWRHKEGVLQLKWRDTRDVLIQTTVHNTDMKEVKTKRGEMKQKPEVVLKYNAFMSGIDKVDQMMSYYDILRRSVKWYRKVVLRILHIMMINSSIFFNASMANRRQQYNLIKFHEVVKGMIEESKHQIPSGAEEQVQLGHFPQMLPPRPNGQKGRRKCRQCLGQQKKTATFYCCAGCVDKPPLCVLCFSSFRHI